MVTEKSKFTIKRYQLEHLVPLYLTIISIYFWLYYLKYNVLSIIGLIVNVKGLVMWWSAKITLSENWYAGFGKPKLRKLVTSGIYSKISNHLYWGINLTLIGLALISPKPWLIVIVLIIVVYFFIRMKVEDRSLKKKLGKKYLQYKSKTWI